MAVAKCHKYPSIVEIKMSILQPSTSFTVIIFCNRYTVTSIAYVSQQYSYLSVSVSKNVRGLPIVK